MKVRRQQATAPVKVSSVGAWWRRVIVLWEEDDASRAANDSGRLRAGPGRADCGPRTELGAWEAITGERFDQRRVVATYDGGDCQKTLCEGGWVLIDSYDGQSIGVLVEVVTEEREAVL